MKCAKELVEMKLAKCNDWQNKKILKEKQIFTDTIDFCEKTVNDAMIKDAENINKNFIGVYFKLVEATDKFKHKVLHPIKRESVSYADGTPSYCIDYSKSFSKEVFEEYLSQHCFKVNWSNTAFKSYGVGWMNAIELAITI